MYHAIFNQKKAIESNQRKAIEHKVMKKIIRDEQQNDRRISLLHSNPKCVYLKQQRC
jgi:hypothetical protein